MKHRSIALLAVLVMLMTALVGCAQPAANAPTDNPTILKATEVPSSAGAKEATEAPKATDAPKTADAPSAPKDIASSAAFKYYLAVNLGMTKDEAEKAIGLPAEKATGQYDPEGAYNFLDKDGNGVYVIYTKDNVVYSKVALYTKEAEAVAPLTAKPVKKDAEEVILKGASHADIITLLGGDGVECARTAMEKDPTGPAGTIFRWANTDGSFLQIAFDATDTAQNVMFHDAN